MIIVKGDAVTEVTALLEQLQVEDSLLKEQEETIKERRTAISIQVKKFASTLGGDIDRVFLPAGDDQWWDRRVSRKGGGLDLDLLRQNLGDKVVNKICDRIVSYVFNSNKLASAYRRGIITERDMAAATVKPTLSYSLYRIPITDLSEDEDES